MALSIEQRFRGNLDRVRNIVKLYVSVAGLTPGRSSVQEADVLRAAVILLHASLEDLLRGLAETRLPHSGSETLSRIPLVGKGNQRKTTFNLGDLVTHRGGLVDDVIAKSVIAYLERSNYNNVGDIKDLLEGIGLSSVVDPYAKRLATLMSRRHLIAHRADHNESSGSGQHQARSISKSAVETWIETVDQFGMDLLARR